MARHILELKGALEFARFPDPNIREAVNKCLNNIASDMEEVEYEDSIITIRLFKSLQDCITEYENEEQIVSAPDEANSNEVENGEVDREPESVEFNMSDEVDRVISEPSASEDDDIES